jgi:hypothetical protein
MADVTGGYVQGEAGFYRLSDRSGPYSIDALGNATLIGASTVGVKQANQVPKGDQQIAIANLQAVNPLTPPIAGATLAVVQNNTTQAMRWRDNGASPTILVGQRIAAGDDLTYFGDLTAFKIIAEASGTGTVDIVYYSWG